MKLKINGQERKSNAVPRNTAQPASSFQPTVSLGLDGVHLYPRTGNRRRGRETGGARSLADEEDVEASVAGGQAQRTPSVSRPTAAMPARDKSIAPLSHYAGCCCCCLGMLLLCRPRHGRRNNMPPRQTAPHRRLPRISAPVGRGGRPESYGQRGARGQDGRRRKVGAATGIGCFPAKKEV